MSVSSISLLFYLPKCTNSATSTNEICSLYATVCYQFLFGFLESAVFGFISKIKFKVKFKHVIQILYKKNKTISLE